jgi:hypothetical protein
MQVEKQDTSEYRLSVPIKTEFESLGSSIVLLVEVNEGLISCWKPQNYGIHTGKFDCWHQQCDSRSGKIA